MTITFRSAFLTCLILAVPGLSAFAAEEPPAGDAVNVLVEGRRLTDPRLQPPKDLNGHFPFVVPETMKGWEKRKADLKQRVLVATGLWPMPEKTPLNAVIHGKVRRDGFTVEKVYFESLPGHFVSGLLFRPEGPVNESIQRPGILSPHGHGGRQGGYSDSAMKTALETGAEFLPNSGQYPKIARCAHLARMGCVAFIFDMLGYEDSQQISYELAHRYKAVRPEMEGLNDYGFFSGQAEGRLHTIMGLQTWNAIRALDFLESLPDVDPHRLAVTGGSGGGTQTILLGAIDDRPIASFPNGMVSTSMQGGCTCENCSLLRIETGNVELAALFAPKPQGMTAADDWTVDMMSDGYPQLQRLYTMSGHPENVICAPLLEFPHNYNAVTRRIMYDFVKQHLQLSEQASIVETDWQTLTKSEYAVWNEDHPTPEGGIEYERKLMKQLAERDEKLLFQHSPHPNQVDEYLQLVRAGWQTIIGRTIDDTGEMNRDKAFKRQEDGFLVVGDLLTEQGTDEQLPVVSVYPTSVPWNSQVVLWFSGDGKGSLFPNRSLHASAKKLVDAGYAVVTADLFGQGELTEEGKPLQSNPLVSNPRPFAGYTLGYNHSVFARRVHDVLKVVKWVQTVERQPDAVHVIGVNGAGPAVAVARGLAGPMIAMSAIDTQGFRFAGLADWKHVNFLPGAIKYGDVPAVLAMGPQQPLWLSGETEIPEILTTVNRASGKTKGLLQLNAGTADNVVDSAVQWILNPAE